MKEKRFKRIYIEITNICNMNCKFCPKDIREKKSMTLQEIEEVFNKVGKYTDYIYLHVKGEPLIYPDIQEVLELANKYNLKVIITTNGTLLKERRQILNKSTALRQINISVHSFEQNGIKENNEYLKNVIDSAKEIAENNDVYISYRLWNLDSIDNVEKDKIALLKIGQEYNIDNILKKVKKDSYIKLGEKEFVNLDTIFEWPNINGKFISETGTCLGLKEQLGILVDGTVVPCCLDYNGEICLGNIFKNSMEQILESNLTKQIIAGFDKGKLTHPLCRRCEFRVNKRR